jgi:hypothetical protein
VTQEKGSRQRANAGGPKDLFSKLMVNSIGKLLKYFEEKLSTGGNESCGRTQIPFKYMKLKKLVEPLFITLIISIAALTNFWHIIYYYIHRPAGTGFIGISHYYQDYFYYLSQVTQGAQGNWLIRNLYTTENIPASPLWFTNILIGKFAALFNLPPWTAYDASILIISIISLYTTYYAIRKIFPQNPIQRIGCFALSVFTTCYYLTIRGPNGLITLKPYEYFYSYTLSLNRLGGVVHLMIQNILTLLTILIFARILTIISDSNINIQKWLRLSLIFSGILMLLMFINPEYVAVDAIAIALTSLIYLIVKPNIKKLGFLVGTALISALPLTIAAIIIFRTFSIPFYQYFRYWESSIKTVNATIFFTSMGPILIFMVLGIFQYLKKATPLRILGLIWVIIPIIAYFTNIPAKLTLPYFRLTQPPNYVIFAAIAAEGIMGIGLIISQIIRRNIKAAVFILIIIAFLSFQIPMINHEIIARRNAMIMDSWMNNPDPKLISGLLQLAKMPHDHNVIAFNLLETMVPAVTGMTSYTGHESLTINYGAKIGAATRFFNCGMTIVEVHKFINENNLGYVVWKNADGNSDHFSTCLPFLNKVFDNGAITIFTTGI